MAADARGFEEIYRVLRPLGAREHVTYAATRSTSRDLLVVQRFAAAQPAESSSPTHAEDALREARVFAKNWHPNVARIRHVDLMRGGEIVVASDYIDGVTLSDLLAGIASRQAPGGSS